MQSDWMTEWNDTVADCSGLRLCVA